MTTADDAVIWMRPEATGRGRAPGYTRSQIANAAIAIADAEGLEAVTMRRVAKDIGAGPMSLYRYVRTKEELHLLMANEVVGPLEEWIGPENSDLATTLSRLARATRRQVLAHPWWAQIVSVSTLVGPKWIDVIEGATARLGGLSLDIDEMMEIPATVRTFALGYAQNEARRGQAEANTEMAQWGPYISTLIDSGNYPYLRRIIADARGPHEHDPDAHFERALARLVTGIQATIAQ
ncbi:TetR/AcrR family transcriptional regulator C-terminal domain-containing protein [Nocardia sp. NPDC088792]|uniref:TetR/AcrR family transcriptional regulator C-terminal domain-containing protein n=1 Tax=Nocardia sp. NPDC088792 TaxID=3364332 RepID=UPI00381C27AA